MACNRTCKECPRKAYVNTVTFTDGTVILTLPDTVSYNDCGKYCFVITTALPAGITLNAPVVAVVGTGTTQFPLLNRCGAPVLSQQINSRCRYPFRVNTTATGGTMTVLCNLRDVDRTTLSALNDAADAG